MEIEKKIIKDLQKIGLPTRIWATNGKHIVMLFNYDDSIKFFDFCDKNNINITGADGFIITKGNKRQPDLSFIYDASTTEQNRIFMVKDKNERANDMKKMYFEFSLSEIKK